MGSEAIALLRTYLQQRSDSGTRFVALKPQLRKLLPALGKSRPAPISASLAPASATQADRAPVAPPAQSDALPATLPVHGVTKEEKLAHLAEQAEECAPARALGTLRGTMVFAVGSPDTRIMFVGEAPGAEEERQREPFVGPAGQRLTKIIAAMGLRREDVYITNICKFRPAMENQGNGNRPPSAEEMRACLPIVLTEIEVIRPEIIVALGATASAGLGIQGPVGRNRGNLHEVHGIPVVVTYHPSYILRQEQEPDGGITAKKQVWDDMLRVMDAIGMPVSEKQRGYFRGR
jgi:DNA polymerase